MYEKPMGGKKLQFFKLIISILFLNKTYSADTTKKTEIDLNNIVIENGFQYNRKGITLQQIRIKYNNEEFKIKTEFDQPKSDKFGVSKNRRDEQWHCDLPIAIYYNLATHPDKKQTLNDVRDRLSDIIKNEVLDFKKLIENFPDSTLLICFRYDDDYSDVYNIKNNTYQSVKYSNAHWTDTYIDWELYKNDEVIKKESIPAFDPGDHFKEPLIIHIILWDPKPEDKSKNDINNLDFIYETYKSEKIKMKKIRIKDKENKTFKIKTNFDKISKTKCSGSNSYRDGQWNLDLPIEIFYNEATHPDKEQTLEYIKTGLSDIIKDEVLDFDKLKANFPDSNLLIHYSDDYADIYDIRTNTYRYLSEKINIDYKMSNAYMDHYLYKNIINPNKNIINLKEYIPEKDQRYHFTNPQAIHIILCDEKKEKNKPHKNNTKDGIMNKGEEGDKNNKSNDSKIPTKTKDKNNKKGKKPSIQTPNGAPKSNQCCKCCQCCPCCKQKT